MTITYTGEVCNGSSFGCFWTVLRKWRGSVYKLVWRELLAYLFLYYLINLLYRFGLNDEQQRVFERIRLYFSQQSETIPMSFVMGFYVSLVVKRWWEQYRLLPWPDTLALFLNAGIPGADERQRLMRRNIVRYAVLAYVITLQRVSLRVKKRFPSWQHVVDSGLMLESERKIFELMDGKTPMSKYWMPLVWATNIINRARKEGMITSDHIVQTLLTELSDIRRRLGALIGYDTVCVPLVYTQVVTLALYTYFIAALLGRQFVPNATEPVGKFEAPDMFFPFFTALQFCFYLGWLKVAEVLINPFGEDDDDIELNWLIDRHIKASYMIVDEMHEEHPELLKDQYWDDVVPKDLPYTVASEHYRREEPKGSAEKYKVKTTDAMYANLISPRKTLVDDNYADYESVDTPIVQRRKSSNWFTRQISRTRMGSGRSASTAYSSGGLFSRHRGNSVDAETAGIPQPKMSIYDRLVGRKSGRNQRHTKQSNGRLSIGGAQNPLKSRPRIPTPDVTKEVVDRENRLALHAVNLQNPMSGVTLMQHHGIQNASYPNYPSSDMPVVQVVLSPIQELDGTSSVNNTLHANQPGTAALAQAILSPGVGPVLTTPVSLPMTVSQLTSLGLAPVTNSPLVTRTMPVRASPTFAKLFNDSPKSSGSTAATITEHQSDDDLDECNSNGSKGSGSHVSNTTASIKSKSDGETERKISMNTPTSLASPNLESLNSEGGETSRKTSVASQSNNSSSPKREVYV
ncbi:bestrophin homolog 15 isoform X1 [Atheta coriaria]|uniref:bestrophin homolog 15 isoform X1 n=2 Tax=Dalotia coriaria TaxID=877792 RepID=UPI0031F35DC0